MNKTFKVARSLTRGTVVTSEAASSRQGKAIKTIVAAVAASLAVSGAMAASWEVAPENATKADSLTAFDKVADNTTYTAAKGAFLQILDEKTFAKNLWIQGVADTDTVKANPLGIEVVGAKAELTNTGKIFINRTGKEAADSLYYKANAINVQDGATAVNQGLIFAVNGVGMNTSRSNDQVVNTSINGEHGEIYVEGNGVGMSLDGSKNAKGENYGLISATPKTDSTETIAVQIGSTGVSFLNEGKIVASKVGEKEATAILVKGSNSIVTLGAKSDIEGKISVTGNNNALNLKGTKDILTIATGENVTGTTITVTDGSDVELADKQGATYESVDIQDGKFSASIWKEDNTFKSVKVGEDGIFNITKLNASSKGQPTDPKAEKLPNDMILIARNQSLTLDGGVLMVANKVYTGSMKIGSSSQDAGTLTITAGDYSFDTVRVYTDGTLAVNGGSLTVNNLDLALGFNSKDEAQGKAPSATLSGNGKLTINDKLTANKSEAGENKSLNKLTVSGGELITKASNLFAADAKDKTKLNWDSDTGMIDNKGGIITVSDVQSLSIADIEKAVGKYSNLQFANVDVKLEEGKTEVEFTNTTGNALINETVKVNVAEGATDKTAVTAKVEDKSVGFGALAVDSTVKNVNVEGTGTLTLSGASGNVIDTTGKIEKFTVASGTLVLGKDATSAGTVNAAELSANKLTVKGAFSAEKVTLTGEESSVESDASFTVANLDSGKLAVSGLLDAGTIGEKAQVTVNDSGVAVLGGAVKGSVTASAPVTTTLALTDEELITIDNKKYITTNGNVKSILKNSVFAEDLADSKNGITSVLYIDDTIEVGEKGKVTVGNSTAANQTVSLGTDAATVLDASKFVGKDKVVVKGNIAGGGKFGLINVTTLGTIKLAEKDSKVDGITDGFNQFEIDNNFVASQYKKADHSIYLTVNEGVVGEDLVDVVTTAFGNSKNGEVFRAIGNEESFVEGTGATKTLNELGHDVTTEYLAAPVVAGVYNVAYDAAEQVNATLARRNLEPTTGMGVWADVFYSANEGKKIYGGEQGYSTDIYGGVIGFDTVFSCGAKLGAALTIGTGDGDSEKSLTKYSTDSDFYGLSVYTGKNVGDTNLYLSADASYLWVDNDISGSIAGASVGESVDSNVFTIGARADWKLFEDNVVNVVPHIGMRYTAIDVDDYRGLESDSMNVFEVPVGVKVAGNFETNGMKIVPAFDFTVVPQVGDTQVNTVVGDVDVIDDLYNAALGVEATTGNFTFGLNYKYGFGKDDRSNNSFNANVRYTF